MGDLSDNFSLSEMVCPCQQCTPPTFTLLVLKLQAVRDALNVPLIITSGYRCQAYNKEIGGAENSAHLTGEAADIAIPNDTFRWHFLDEAIGHFKRIGLYTKHAHIDVSETLPSPRLWVDMSK